MKARAAPACRLIGNKRGTASETLGEQGIIELIMIILVAIFFIIYGVYVVKDQRMHMSFYSKELSLLQDALQSSEEDVRVSYHGYGIARQNRLIPRFSDFKYLIEQYYTTVINGNELSVSSRERMEKSYIHLSSAKSISPDSRPIGAFDKPDMLYLLKDDSRYIVSGKKPDRLLEMQCPGKLTLYKNEQIFFQVAGEPKDAQYEPAPAELPEFRLKNYVPEILGGNLDAILEKRPQSSGNSDKFGLYLGVGQSTSNRITIYYPFGTDSTFACQVYNSLISLQQSNQGIDIRLVPTDSIDAFGSRYNLKRAVFIELPMAGELLPALSSVARLIDSAGLSDDENA